MEMTILSRSEYEHLRAVLPAATKDSLRDTFSISETTWRKLRLGEPIRRTTYERLIARFERLKAQGASGKGQPSAKQSMEYAR